jgi:hypothetical protein
MTGEGKEMATWQPETARFRCRMPYDLVIQSPVASENESKYPEN